MKITEKENNTIAKWLEDKWPELFTEKVKQLLEVVELSNTGTMADDAKAVLLMNLAKRAGHISFYELELKAQKHVVDFDSWQEWNTVSNREIDSELEKVFKYADLCMVFDRRNLVAYCCFSIASLQDKIKALEPQKAETEKAIEKTQAAAQAARRDIEEAQKRLDAANYELRVLRYNNFRTDISSCNSLLEQAAHAMNE